MISRLVFRYFGDMLLEPILLDWEKPEIVEIKIEDTQGGATDISETNGGYFASS